MPNIRILQGDFKEKLELPIAEGLKAGFPSPAEDYSHETLDFNRASFVILKRHSTAKCSKDIAIRDIQDLVEKNILIEDIPGAKRPSYSIVYDAEDLTQFFTEVNITEENGIPYLKALFKGKKPICERVLKLDADRYKKGDLPLSNLLSKYCSYIVASNRE